MLKRSAKNKRWWVCVCVVICECLGERRRRKIAEINSADKSRVPPVRVFTYSVRMTRGAPTMAADSNSKTAVLRQRKCQRPPSKFTVRTNIHGEDQKMAVS